MSDEKILKLPPGGNLRDQLPGTPLQEMPGADEFNGTDLEMEWFLNALACRMGMVYDANELDRCYSALGKTRKESQTDGDVAFAIVKSFFRFINS
jgi:hypothetical protein